MGFKIKKTVNGETVWEPIKAKKYTASKTIEYTGTLPITINANGDALIDYRIYGNTVQTGTPTPENPIMPNGCGERTENLFDKGNYNLIRANAGTAQNILYGNPSVSPYAVYIPVTGGETYSFYSQATLTSSCFTMKTPALGVSIVLNGANTFGSDDVRTAPADAKYLVVFLELSSVTQDRLDSDLATLTIVKSSTAPTSYIPYGYKLPMVSRGENLWDSELEQGTFDISTGEERDASERIRSDYIHIQNSDNYTITLTGAEGVVVYVYDANKSFLSAESTVEWQALPFTREIEANRYVRFAFAKSASGGYYEKITPSDVSNIMLVKGSTVPDSYIPYYREETPIYLGESQTTRMIKKLVLTGEENGYKKNVTNPSDYLYYLILGTADIPKAIPNNKSICTHLKYGTYSQGDFSFSKSGNILYFNFGSDIMNAQPSGNTVKSLKEYLAAQYANGTPVTFWYVLAEPETGIVNEPLMKIGDYADAIDSTQTTVHIPTSKGTTVIDYDGTPKPEQMYVKYNSWSGWSDIDDYKMVNGNWTQEAT